ncbi:hypothetical protein KIPB_001137 [Kipferlia bialata]|uniref:Uncharacterized protein n=1 Tax=Kipferlia bialata TaxID=797122 RepID=A0A391NRW8_9EUKA|nr:hypothetical protein KIPB_001137 [Kipferlia bialata]|eukprot:g1137.t1
MKTLQLENKKKKSDGLSRWVTVDKPVETPVWDWRERAELYRDTPALHDGLRVSLVPSDWGVVYVLVQIWTADEEEDIRVYDALDVYVLELDTLTWGLVDQREGDVWPVPMEVRAFACIDYGLVIAGGLQQESVRAYFLRQDPKRIVSNTIWRLDAESETWKLLGKIPADALRHMRGRKFHLVGNTIVYPGSYGCVSIHLTSSPQPTGVSPKRRVVSERERDGTRRVDVVFSEWPQFEVGEYEFNECEPIYHILGQSDSCSVPISANSLLSIESYRLMYEDDKATLFDPVGLCPLHNVPQPYMLPPILDHLGVLATETADLKILCGSLINPDTFLLNLECTVNGVRENVVTRLFVLELLPALFSYPGV